MSRSPPLRSPRLPTPASQAAGAPAISVSAGAPVGVKGALNRRWSLDNLSDNEGYVRDLRRLHLHQTSLVAIRDEEYPFMLTEKDDTQPDDETEKVPPSTSSSRIIHNVRSRSASMDFCKPMYRHHQHHHHPIHHTPAVGHHAATIAHMPVKGNRSLVSPFSFTPGNVDISVVPEERELSSSVPPSLMSPRSDTITSPQRKLLEAKLGATTKAFLRQRSSSLPRILPPIMDSDGAAIPEADIISGVHDRQSAVVVREMQKFVCSQAADMSSLLPIPLPSNAKQSRISFKTPAEDVPVWEASTRTEKAVLVASTLAKIHGIIFAIKQVSAATFKEFVATLGLEQGHLDAAQANTILQEARQNNIQLEEAKMRRHLASLTSPSAALPFTIIVHGNINMAVMAFKTSDEGRAKVQSVRLPGLNKAFLGSPLLDLYSLVLDLWLDDYEREGSRLSEMVLKLLRVYNTNFNETCRLLSVDDNFSFPLQQLFDDFAEFFDAGMLLTCHIRRAVDFKKCSPANDTSSNSEVKMATPLSKESLTILNSSTTICKSFKSLENPS